MQTEAKISGILHDH